MRAERLTRQSARRHLLPLAFWLSAVACCWGCDLNSSITATQPEPAADSAAPFPTPTPADNASVTLTRDNRRSEMRTAPRRLQHQVAVLHVCVPSARRDEIAAVWDLFREDVIDAETRFRLAENGLRVGIGHGRFWQSVKELLDGIEGHWVARHAQLKVPAGVPLALELEEEPRDVTLFHLGADGVLTGNTYADCRAIYRIQYFPDPHDAEAVILTAQPELHQKQRGWEYVRSDNGFYRVPKQLKVGFPAVSFSARLGPGEFVLIGPSEAAGIEGMLGGEFLHRAQPDREDVSLIFLHPRVQAVGTR